MNFFAKSQTYVIAEMANSHEGNLDHAKKITMAAAQAGAQAIKFHKFTADELAEPNHENYQLYKKLEMPIKDWKKLIDFAKKKKLHVFVDIFGVKSAKEISKFNIDGYKIHSADLTNPHLLKLLGKLKKPILLSTAGSKINEIENALKILQKNPKEIVLMHGFQSYPTKLEDMNLSRLKTLQTKYDLRVGLMDHVSGDSEMALIIPLMGIVLGANVIEKHLTIDRKKKGLDYYSAIEPSQFKKLLSLIHKTKKSLGKPEHVLSPNELTYRLIHKKNPISKQFIKKETVLNDSMLEFKRTKKKQTDSFLDLQGMKLTKNIPKGTIITKKILKNKYPKIVAALACRVDSTRLFAKPLQNVGNKTILELLLNQIKKSQLIDEIVLAISEKPGNESFIQFAKKNKIKYILGDDHNVLQRLISATKHVNADVVFRITTENPFIYWEGIDKLIKHHVSGNYDFSFYEKLPLGTDYEVINLKSLELSHKKGSKKHRSELCSLYINENTNKFKINRTKISKTLQRPEFRLTVDSPNDLIVARIIHKNLNKNDKPIPLKHIIKFLDEHQEITKINSKIPLGVSKIWI